MQNFHAIHIKYMWPTDTKGSRIKLTSKRFEQSVTLYRDSSILHAIDQAADYLTSKGFTLVGTCEDGDIILTNTFEPIK